MPPSRDGVHFLKFNCYQFSRGVEVRSRRWVSIDKCLCTDDTAEICDRSTLYGLWFGERAKYQKKDYEENLEIPRDRIGTFRLNYNRGYIRVPPHFMDALWTAALAADGALRRIELIIQQHNSEVWNVFEATLTEELAEPFELPVDEQSRPKIGPPRANPVLLELRALRAQLRLGWSRVGPGIVTIAIGVLVALWIARLWR
jgi:hypothetical protein